MTGSILKSISSDLLRPSYFLTLHDLHTVHTNSSNLSPPEDLKFFWLYIINPSITMVTSGGSIPLQHQQLLVPSCKGPRCVTAIQRVSHCHFEGDDTSAAPKTSQPHWEKQLFILCTVRVLKWKFFFQVLTCFPSFSSSGHQTIVGTQNEPAKEGTLNI